VSWSCAGLLLQNHEIIKLGEPKQWRTAKDSKREADPELRKKKSKKAKLDDDPDTVRLKPMFLTSPMMKSSILPPLPPPPPLVLPPTRNDAFSELLLSAKKEAFNDEVVETATTAQEADKNEEEKHQMEINFNFQAEQESARDLLKELEKAEWVEVAQAN